MKQILKTLILLIAAAVIAVLTAIGLYEIGKYPGEDSIFTTRPRLVMGHSNRKVERRENQT